jgi:molecular chaperone GrpE
VTEQHAAGNHSAAQDPEAVVGEETSEPTPAAAASESVATDPEVIELEALEAEVADQQDADVVATSDDAALAAERLADLQRLQAEYVNYKRRVDRDRALVQERAAQSVIEALLPVLDDIHAAREHGDLTDGPFAAIADKLEGVLGKFGLERYGAVGEDFDPMVHEALMHTAWPQDGSVTSTGSTAVVQVLQPGYRAGEQVLRAARVAVADPE